MANVIAGLKEEERLKRLRRAQTDLWWLATEMLDIHWLSEKFHRPIYERLDEYTSARFSGDLFNALELWGRDHIKSFTRMAQCIQYNLRDPLLTAVWWHDVEEKAAESGEWIARQWQSNDKLRALRPDICPPKSDKRFFTGGSFDLPPNKGNRFPTFKSFGTGSEATGSHCRVAFLDDIIGLNTLMNNEMPKVRQWYRTTVCNVLMRNGWIDATGTRWDSYDIYSDWISSPDWKVVVRAALEDKEGRPDYDGEPVFLTRAEIEKKRRQSGPDFAAQMMNDPSPQGQKPWTPECERYIALKETAGPGFVIVLVDPAPAKVGSMNQARTETGDKDYWANAVVKLRRRGQRSEIILLDGSFSREWTTDEGMEEVCRLQMKWNTPHVAIERGGPVMSMFDEAHVRVARTVGAKHSAIELTSTYKGKNALWGALCSRALQDEFLICSESCNADYLAETLNQARDWRPTLGGKNTLRYDDCANVVSFACDSAFANRYPQAFPNSMTPWEEAEEQPMQSRARYCIA